VTVEGRVTGEIGAGLMILLGVGREDSAAVAASLAEKAANLRIFEDDQGKMNRSLLEVKGAALVVSQFTLYASTKKGHRPSWSAAARPEIAQPVFDALVAALTAELGKPVPTGEFGAHMRIALVNDGPVTIWLDSRTRE